MIENNLLKIKKRIEEVSKRVKLTFTDITIVAVTKQVNVQKILQAANFGIKNFGENRLQEAIPKIEFLKQKNQNFIWHFIGHLQSNKVKKVVRLFDLIQSVDSISLAEKIDSEAKKINKIQDCLIQLKVSEEETKYGCLADDVFELVKKINDLKNIRLCGIMTIPPFFENPEHVRPYFRFANEVLNKFKSLLPLPFCQKPILSMGMSNDFEVAIEEGANMVRIGQAIFGLRS